MTVLLRFLVGPWKWPVQVSALRVSPSQVHRHPASLGMVMVPERKRGGQAYCPFLNAGRSI